MPETTILFSLPQDRSRHQMVYNAKQAKMLLFGGYDGGQLDATWQHDGLVWVVVGGPQPTAREGHAMVYDDLNDRALMVGGFNGTTRLNDTWAFNTAWTQLTPATPPTPIREQHAMAWTGTQAVMFGGFDGTSLLADTWGFNGSTWTLLVPTTTSPSARQGHMMAYDAVRGTVLLFGGHDGNNYLNDTWEWDGLDWTLLSPAESPTIRSHGTMAWDSTRDRLLLFGGDQNGTEANDLWEWNSTTWRAITTITTPPSARIRTDIAYDSTLDRFMLFGGFDGTIHERDVWEYRNTSQWRTIGFTYDNTLVEIDTGARLKAAFSTTNPVISTQFFFTVDGIATFAVDGTAAGLDELRFYVLINSQPKWWNGSVWANSDGTFARSNTLQDIADNIAKLPLLASKTQLAVVLHSDDGSTTPEIISATWDLTATTPEVPPVTLLNDPQQIALSNPVVDMSATVTSQSGIATVVEVTLKSVGPLPVVSTQFITDNNLEPEILSKAGLDKDLVLSVLKELSSTPAGDFVLTVVEVTITTA